MVKQKMIKRRKSCFAFTKKTDKNNIYLQYAAAHSEYHKRKVY